MTLKKRSPSCKYCGAKKEKSDVYCDTCNTFDSRWTALKAFTYRPEIFVLFFTTTLILVQLSLVLLLKQNVSKVSTLTSVIMEDSSTYFNGANEALKLTTAIRHEFIYMRPDLTEVPGKRDVNGEELKDAKGNVIKDYQDGDVPAIKIGTNTVILHDSECKRNLMGDFGSWNLCQQYANGFCNDYHPYNVDEAGNPKPEEDIVPSLGSGLITSWGISGIGVTCFNSNINFPTLPKFESPTCNSLLSCLFELFESNEKDDNKD